MAVFRAILIAGFAVIGAAHAATEKPQIMLKSERYSGDYLNTTQAPPAEVTLRAKLFDSSISRELSERYIEIQNRYEERQRYNLKGLADEIRNLQERKDLATWTMRRMLTDHVNRPVRRLLLKSVKDEVRRKRKLEELENEKAQRAAVGGRNKETVFIGPVAPAELSLKSLSHEEESGFWVNEVYAALEDFYNNGWQIDENTTLRFQYDLPSGMADLNVHSEFLDTSINYFAFPLHFSATDGGFAGYSVNAERMTLTLGKNLNELGLSTGMRYGVLNRTLNAGMNKHLVGPVSAGVSQTWQASHTARSETTYRLDVGLSF